MPRALSSVRIGVVVATAAAFAGVGLPAASANAGVAAHASSAVSAAVSPSGPAVPVPAWVARVGGRIGGAPGGAQTAPGLALPAVEATQWTSPTGNPPPLGGSAATAGASSAGLRLQRALGPSGASVFPAPGVIEMAEASTTPAARSYPAGAYDAARNVDVEFGGYGGGSTYFADTWTFDGSVWTKHTGTGPSARSAAAMAFDASTGTTILFGGYNGSTALADTWSWNGTAWTHLSPATSPPARSEAVMAYDAATGTIVLFGGNSAGTDLGDTWSWNGSTWSAVTTPAGLTARSDAGMGYDATGADLVLFGGETGSGTSFDEDTWTYTGSGWTQHLAAHDPGPRSGMGMSYDGVLGRVVLYGGVDATKSYADLWLWNGTDWMIGDAQNNAFVRENFLLVQAAVNGQLMLQGGLDFAGSLYPDTAVIDWGALGTPKNATFETRHLDDRSTYGTNVGNGNLVVAATDLAVAGPGVGLQIQRRLNTLGGYSGWLGQAWALTNSFDTTWAALPDGSIVLNGVRGAADSLFFHKSGSAFTSPAGINATLATAGAGYTLTFNTSGEKLSFNSSGQLTGDGDRNGNTISYGWSGGQPASITDTAGRAYTVTIGTAGTITAITDPSGRTVAYTPNSSGDLIKVVDPASETTNYTYKSDHFKIATLKDPKANTTTIAYRPGSGRMGSVTDPQTTPNTLAYDYNPPAAGIGAWFATTSTDANSHDTVYSSNFAGQVVKVTDALGHSRKATFNANADQLTSVDAVGVGNTTTYGFDALNNPISAQIPTGATTHAYYANTPGVCSSSDSMHPYLAKCVNDAQNNQTTFSYDGPGNLLTSTNTGTGASQTFTYNPATPTCGGKVGQLCSSEDGNSHTTSYHYDAAGNLTTITPPTPLGAITQTFDTMGRVATVTDGNGHKTTYSYDGDDRITQVLLLGATSCTYTAGTCVGFGHDGNGNVTTMHDKTGLTQYGFDVMNRQTTKTLPNSDVLAEGYDHVGNVTSFTDGADVTGYGYNAANQLTSLTEPGGSCSGAISLCTTFGVNNNGQRTSTTYPGTTVMTTTLDNAGRPTEVKTVNGSTVIADFTYTYTNTGADTEIVQTRTDVQAARTTTYGYDARNEVTRATEKNGSTITAAWVYCYDTAGNRTNTSTSTSTTATCTTTPTTSYGYNTAEELTKLNGSTSGWSYDGNGNETAAASPLGARSSETYSGADQLTSITEAGTTTAMSYAGLSNDERVTAGTTSFDYGAQGLAHQSVAGTPTSWTRDPAGTLIGQRSSTLGHDYYVMDGQGSIIALVDSTGTVLDTYSYDPYGATRTATGTTPNPYRYTGGQLDATGLYHLGARFYDPTLGRFTQQDPARQEPNAYAYAGSCPLTYEDPNGLIGSPCAVGSLAAGAAALFPPFAIPGGLTSLFLGGLDYVGACGGGIWVPDTSAEFYTFYGI